MGRAAAVWSLGLLLTAAPARGRATGVGERLTRWSPATTTAQRPAGAAFSRAGALRHTWAAASGVMQPAWPDTSRRATAVADTATRRPALVPDTTPTVADDDKPTRKTILLTTLAIAVLTVATLLLYNVRSR